MLRRLLIIFGIAGAVFVMCEPRGTEAMLSFNPADMVVSEDEREEFHQTYALAANGRVSVENINGFVHIKVWDREELQLDVLKRAPRRDRLEEAKIDVSATPESIRIKTVYPYRHQTFYDDEKGRYNNPATVDYTLTVPRKARLESIELVNGSLEVDGLEGPIKGSSINGRVVARGLSAETRLSTVNGNLEATFTQLNEAAPINLGSVNGNVVLVIPSDSQAIVRAGTVHGDITNEFGLEVQHGEYVGHELYGQIGSGGSRIKLSNVNGGIAIKHAQDGKQRSTAVSLQTDNEKVKAKVKAAIDSKRAAAAQKIKRAEARRVEVEVQKEQGEVDAETARELQETQREIQREVEQAIRQAQREIERAQREIQRETERQVREQIRMENRGVGKGFGKGRGEGVGGAQLLERESKTFAVSGQPRVNIGTFDGAVTVRAWDKSEVMYTAAKRGSDEEELKQIAIQAEQQGSAVSIIARSESSGSASLEVFVPRKSILHVSSDDGQLRVEGVSGQINLRTGDGSIEVSDSEGALQVNTGDGHIRISKFDGQVDARTGDGAISLEGKFAELTARTGDGSITLAVPADANFTVETDAEEVNNEGLNVSEDIAPSPRLKRWRVGRGGQVFVLSTGDGRIVLRSL
jgi:DUF4097 and DUF4098 domain-containing protein YvlB